MQFYDEVKISVQSGRGGDGLASGRRESWVPFWWPNGWDGGKWWDVYFVANKDLNTLVPFKYRKIFQAEKGEPWRTKDQYGAGGKDIFLEVPIGTLIKDTATWRLLHHFSKDKENWKVLKGGEGGRGNIHFKSPTLQYPNFALMGEPWAYQEVTLELQLLGDLALIGNPSVGKTSLINTVAHTKAKVAEYHFTTLIPNLWSVEKNNYHFNIIDIPGLIAGASEWKGLGNYFLRHVLKSRIFCFMLDASRYEQGMQETLDLLEEILNFIEQKIFPHPDCEILLLQEDEMLTLKVIDNKNDEELLHKKIVFLLSKYDLMNDEEILWEYKTNFFQQTKKQFTKLFKNPESKKISDEILEKNFFVIASFIHLWLDEWLNKMTELLKKTPIPYILQDEQKVGTREEFEIVKEITATEKPKLIQENYLDEVEAKYLQIWEITHPEICKLAFTLPWWNDEAEMWFWWEMESKWFVHTFLHYKIHKGDILKIKSFYEGLDDKYIVY